MIEELQSLPQIKSLGRIVALLWQRTDVVAIWLGGSLAAKKGDLYSDIDLRIAIDPESYNSWSELDYRLLLRDLCPAVSQVFFGDRQALFQVVMSNGEILDLHLQSYPPQAVEAQIVMLEARDSDCRETIEGLQQPHEVELPEATSDNIAKALTNFWIGSHKHRKVLHRDLDLIAQFGIQLERDVLKRLWYVNLTGKDEPRNKTIHSLTAQSRAISEGMGPHALEVLGLPTRTRSEILHAIEVHQNEVSKVGQVLATKMNFEYPHAIEKTARQP